MNGHIASFILLLTFTGQIVAQELVLGSNPEEIAITPIAKLQRTLILPDLEGLTHNLSEWRGKVILLNFWASWCAPCQYEIHDLVAWQEKYGTRDLQVIGVGVDVAQKLRNVRRSLEINYPILIAEPSRYPTIMSSWGNRMGTLPHSVVINREGQMVYIHRGLISEETFTDHILPLLSATSIQH
jgi:thiol-disulfide isomerase/thioredoxin